jgi:hypothetical protein
VTVVHRVEVPATERGEFPVTQAREGGEQDEDSEASRDAAGDVEDLGDGGDRSLGRVVFAGTRDAAWVAPDQFIVNGGIEHRVQEAVRLRGHRGSGAGRDEFGVPGPDHAGREVAEQDRAQGGFDVLAVQPPVELPRAGSQVGPMIYQGGPDGPLAPSATGPARP